MPYSYAQHFQDLWFLWETGFASSGYFVEFGALNGRDFSNTYILEKLGWNGVVAEPHPAYREQIHKNRNCVASTKCVYRRSGERIKFNLVYSRPALSYIGHLKAADNKANLRRNFREVEVETISLDDLLCESQAPSIVDCLSVDTEGSEAEILKGVDFSLHLINCICVEHNNTADRKIIFDLLTEHGYKRKWEQMSGHDDWYIREGAYADWNTLRRNQAISQLKALPPFTISYGERECAIRKLIDATR